VSERREVERSFAVPALAAGAHKGDAGRVVSICGSRPMPGAAVLVARAAQRAGAGLVTAVCLAEELVTILPAAAPEAVLLEVAELGELPFALSARDPHAIVAGPGLGASAATRALVHLLLTRTPKVPLVLDADALNVLEGAPERLREHAGATVVTPHPGEAGKLLGRAIPREAAGREAAALELASATGAIVVLKGRASVVTDGRDVYVNDTGNPGMATAGAGDVLTGILGAYLAPCAIGNHPEWTPFDAACAAVRAHGLAGDLAAAHLGQRAVIASDLIQWLSQAQRRLSS
jgi:NAD(P)H-hydrate epimerase